MQRKKSGLGWMRDLPDPRDHVYSAPLAMLQALPTTVDLAPTFPVYNQGRIGSCTANALAGALQFDRVKSGQSPDFIPSRLFIYYNERVIEGDPSNDGGAQLRDGIKSLQQKGVCPENEWSYDDTPAAYPRGPVSSWLKAGHVPATDLLQRCGSLLHHRLSTAQSNIRVNCRAAWLQGFRLCSDFQCSTDGTIGLHRRQLFPFLQTLIARSAAMRLCAWVTTIAKIYSRSGTRGDQMLARMDTFTCPTDTLPSPPWLPTSGSSMQ